MMHNYGNRRAFMLGRHFSIVASWPRLAFVLPSRNRTGKTWPLLLTVLTSGLSAYHLSLLREPTLSHTCPDVTQLHLIKRATFPWLDRLSSSDHHELPLVLEHIAHPDLVSIDHGKVALDLVRDDER